MDGQLDLALQVWDWESPNPGERSVEVGNMISWDDNLRMWRISGPLPPVIACPLCDEEMNHVPGTERWVCLNISAHEEALSKE